ncbi:MAG: dTDP-4-dehydrorhamnose 3,5-epimerase family protein [Alphaproteobacteria bacterium]|nr:dTDP-4-dehydrorhamnose 3,5-epimerase family protein [Alphaproteobacteria bacterium]
MLWCAMRLEALRIPGAYRIIPHKLTDERGFFARSFCADTFRERGMPTYSTQANNSYNQQPHIVRGMHYQTPPYAEPKIVRCTRGRIYDVIADMRPDSPQYKCWQAVELDADTHEALYIPAGCAHGFQTLTPLSEVHYLMGAVFNPLAQAGFHWQDPGFGIDWPNPAGAIVSAKDAALPFYKDQQA